MTVLPLWRRQRRRPVEPLDETVDRPRDAVVFSGGGSLGAVQVGALRALLEAGVTPDLVTGCSVGSLNAAFFAVAPSLDRVAALEALWLGMSRDHVFPDGRVDVARRLVRRQDHLFSPSGLATIIQRGVPIDDLAETAIPVHVVTTDLLAGRATWWSSGPPVRVLSASACLPAVFPPVPLEGSLHVDGGVTCPVPVQRALDLGARRVWVLDVTSEFHGWADERMSALDVLLESFAISRSLLAQQEPIVGTGQRVVTLPPLGVGRHDLRDFSRTPFLMRVGQAAGRAMIAAELAGQPASASSLATRATPSASASSPSA